jgi:SOS-response transcriptional repressor LexA
MTCGDVAVRLELRGFPTDPKTISKWERGATQPNAAQFLALCEIYDVRDVGAVFGDGKTLNALGLSRLAEYTRFLRSDNMFLERRTVTIRLFDLPASAGTGNYADSDAYEEIEVDVDAVPSGADYCVRVQGDSMEPEYHDGGVVFVRATETLSVGDVGIFALNGDAYIKRLGRNRLVSLNPDYDPIRIVGDDDVRVYGEVVGVL